MSLIFEPDLTAKETEDFAEAAERRAATVGFSPAFQRRLGRREATNCPASATDESDDRNSSVANATTVNGAARLPALKGRAKFRPRYAGDSTRLTSFSRNILLLFSLVLLSACQSASSRQPVASEPVSAGSLTKEYQESTTDARRKYDGKEIIVKGRTIMTAMMPPSASDQGLVFLEENGANPPLRVACWFSNDQSDQFSKIKGGQYITVKGIFNGEAGAELKFCRLVKID